VQQRRTEVYDNLKEGAGPDSASALNAELFVFFGFLAFWFFFVEEEKIFVFHPRFWPIWPRQTTR
jgi:hypothetical protein